MNKERKKERKKERNESNKEIKWFTISFFKNTIKSKKEK